MALTMVGCDVRMCWVGLDNLKRIMRLTRSGRQKCVAIGSNGSKMYAVDSSLDVSVGDDFG